MVDCFCDWQDQYAKGAIRDTRTDVLSCPRSTLGSRILWPSPGCHTIGTPGVLHQIMSDQEVCSDMLYAKLEKTYLRLIFWFEDGLVVESQVMIS